MTPRDDTLPQTEPRRPRPAGAPRARLDLDALLGAEPPDRLALLAALYLALPGLIFLGGWARPLAALVAGGAGLLALALAPGWRRGMSASAVPPRLALLCLALGLAWAALGGAQHWVYSTADWQVRDAVLADLADGPWPVIYGPEGEAGATLLRAPLGYFMPAGLFGQWFGAEAARLALWAWTGMGLALVLALLAALAARIAPARAGFGFAVLAGVFALFHGLDFVANVVLDAQAPVGWLGAWGRGGEWWGRWFQYPGHVTSLLWAPNHTMPAWLAALLVLRHGRSRGFARSVALPLGAGAFWGPVSAAGAAALALAAVWRAGHLRAALLAPANWLAVVFAAPLCLFLTAGASEVLHGPLLALRPVGEALWRWPLFFLVEAGVWAGLVFLVLRSWLLGVAVAMLALIPGYVFGDGNEMAARGSQAALVVLAVAVGAALLAPGAGRRARGALAGAMAIAALGSLTEASLLFTKPAWPPSGCSVPEAARQSVYRNITDWSHYLAPWPDARLSPWMRDDEARLIPKVEAGEPCWPRGGV